MRKKIFDKWVLIKDKEDWVEYSSHFPENLKPRKPHAYPFVVISIERFETKYLDGTKDLKQEYFVSSISSKRLAELSNELACFIQETGT